MSTDEIIASWKKWHRELSDILDCKLLERSVTSDAVKTLKEKVNKLPITADGVSVIPFIDEIFYADKRGVRIMDWCGSESVCDMLDYEGEPQIYKTSNHRKRIDGSIHVNKCHSTKKEAEFFHKKLIQK